MENLSLEERWGRGIHDTTRYIERSVDIASLPIDTTSLSKTEITKRMISRQIRDAFNVAYQGETRLPFREFSMRTNDPVAKIIASGLILAKNMAELSPEEVFLEASKVGGNSDMVAGAFRSFIRGSELADRYNFNGESAGYEFSTAEIGLGILRASKRAATYVLDCSGVFWPHSWDEDKEGYIREQPGFTAEDVVHTGYSAGGLRALINHKELFPELTPELFLAIAMAHEPDETSNFLTDGDYYGIDFALLAKEFNLESIRDISAYTDALLGAGHNDLLWGFYSKFKVKHIDALDIFRSNIDKDSFDFTEAINTGELTEEHTSLGITKKGRAGIDQLRSLMYGIQGFIAKQGKTADEYVVEVERIQQSPIYERVWRAAVRFNKAAWGSTSTNEITRTLQHLEYFARHPENPPKPLDETIYQASSLVPIIERNTTHDKLSSATEERLSSLHVQMKQAWRSNEDDQDYNTRLDDFHRTIKKTYDELAGQQTRELDEAKALKIKSQLALYEGLLDGEYLYELMEGTQSNGFLAAYDKLSGIKMARDILREKALRDARAALGDEIDQAFSIFQKARGDIDRLIASSEIIDHLVIQEHLLKLRPNDNQYESFIRNVLFNTSIIRAQMHETTKNNGESTNTRMLRFIPNRDIGLELSGQIGDACWASKYSSIAEQMPNLTAVLITEDTAGVEKFVGSSLLMEATADDGQELLIIRGLNPLHNVITRLDNNDFLNKFIDYAQSIADKSGRRLAIVHDKVSGASTNRPTLFNAMTLFIHTGDHPKINVPKEQVTFNSYDLEDSIYLV